jgi:hypothetical protein
MPVDKLQKLSVGIFKDLIVAQMNPIIQMKFPYNVDPLDVSTVLVGSGTVTQADSMAVVSSGAATSSSAEMISKKVLVYQPGQGAVYRGTVVYTQGVAGNIQMVGIGDTTDGFFIGYNGTEFGICHRQNGTDIWITEDDMNGGLWGQGFKDKSRLDPTTGNVYQIQYQWLGFGNILFTVFDPRSEEYKVLHKIEYANNAVVPSVYNPSFPTCTISENTTNDTNIQIKVGSQGVFIEGGGSALGHEHAVANSKSVTTETNVLTVRGRATHQSKTNRGVISPDQLSVAADGTKTATFNVYKNATLGGTPSYTEIDTDSSIAEYDTAGTTVTGGTLLGSFKVSKEGGTTVDLIPVQILAGDTITVSAQSANSTTADAALVWKELL